VWGQSRSDAEAGGGPGKGDPALPPRQVTALAWASVRECTWKSGLAEALRYRAIVGGVSIAWRWLVGGVVAIGVGLAVWPTTFILVPTGVVLFVIGMTKSVRSTMRSH
jgi:hypothetical protein